MCDKGHQHCGYESTLLLLLPLTPLLMKLPVPTNKLNECLAYQAVIAGRLFYLPNYWYFLLHPIGPAARSGGGGGGGGGGLLYSICWDSSCGKAALLKRLP